jgi:hypothetical protein
MIYIDEEMLLTLCRDLEETISNYEEKKEEFKENKTVINIEKLLESGRKVLAAGRKILHTSDRNLVTDNDELRKLFDLLLFVVYNLGFEKDIIEVARSNIGGYRGHKRCQYDVEKLKEGYQGYDKEVSNLKEVTEQIVSKLTLTK